MINPLSSVQVPVLASLPLPVMDYPMQPATLLAGLKRTPREEEDEIEDEGAEYDDDDDDSLYEDDDLLDDEDFDDDDEDDEDEDDDDLADFGVEEED